MKQTNKPDAPTGGQGGQVEGEGSYSGARQYDEATRRFVKKGKVEQAARDAAPASAREAEELEAAEEEGRRHAREEDPALQGGQPANPGDDDR